MVYEGGIGYTVVQESQKHTSMKFFNEISARGFRLKIKYIHMLSQLKNGKLVEYFNTRF